MNRAQSLIQRYLTQQISPEELEQLESLLLSDPQLRRQFVREATIDTTLREVAVEQEVSEIPDPAPRLQRFLANSRTAWLSFASLAAAVLLIALTTWNALHVSTVAILISSENAAWESSLPTMPGSKLPAGLLRLKTGIATIRFDSGAEVTLEAPAHLALLTSMRARVIAGAALIDVPDSAIGFVIETPEGYAIDYGTRFAVNVDQVRGESKFELLEGEISVHHGDTGQQVRLQSPTVSAMIADDRIETKQTIEPTPSPIASAKKIRIGTDGRATSVLPNNKRHKFIDPETLSVKTTENGKWDHHSFFAFDLSRVPIENVRSARLRLNLVPSERGFASRLKPNNRFAVYGLTNQDKVNWQMDSTWDDAPHPEDGVLLGTFDIPRSQQRGVFGIDNEALLNFVNRANGGSITLILIRETSQNEGNVPGLIHMFASDLHPESVGPLLELVVE